MNDNIQSQEGLDVSEFPSNIPTYTGHFHKPHTVRLLPPCTFKSSPLLPLMQLSKSGSKVRYVGSPYQTSLSEAHQQKFLYCLRNDVAAPGAGGGSSTCLYSWVEEERIPFNVGKKYFKVRSIF